MSLSEDFAFTLPDDPAQRDRLAEIGQLASSLVHELKNPLGAIGLNAELLIGQYNKKQLQSEKSIQRLQRIKAASSQLTDIINAYLGYTRPKPAEYKAIDINDLLSSILDEQIAVTQDAEISVTCKLDEQLSAVPADEHHLRSVFLNIILNACDALRLRDLGEEKPRSLVIITRQAPQLVRIVIANNGPALSESAAAHLFEPFFSEKDGGTGLGLALVKRLIEGYDGRINVSSDPMQGVSFTIEIPTQLGPAKSPNVLDGNVRQVTAIVHDSDTESNNSTESNPLNTTENN